MTGTWKTQITISFTLAFTLAIRQVPTGEEVAHGRMVKMAAEWLRVGLERLHSCTRFCAQSGSWVAPAQEESSFGTRGELWTKLVKKVEITHFSSVFTIFFSL